jgi:hypothetical protein
MLFPIAKNRKNILLWNLGLNERWQLVEATLPLRKPFG